jgi:hypothetical protein
MVDRNLTELVVDGLELVRVNVAVSPLLLFTGIFVALLAVLKGVRRLTGVSDPPVRLLAAVAGTAAAVGLAVHTAFAVWYLSHPYYAGSAEPSVTAVGWMFQVGRPVYPDLAGEERYAHMYGPMAFIAHGVALNLLGPSIEASKAVGVLASLLSLVLTYLSLRTVVDRSRAVALTGVCAILFVAFRNVTYWTRPDPLQVLMMTIGLRAAVARARSSAVVLVGLSSGLLWNLKLTGPAYSLPIGVLLLANHGVRALFGSMAIGVTVAVLPFVAFGNVSFTNYAAWVRLSARNGLLLGALRENLEWMLFFVVPVVLSLSAAIRSRSGMALRAIGLTGALGAGMAGVAVAASKPGAGFYHLVPFLPVVFYLSALHLREVAADRWKTSLIVNGALAFVLCSCVLALVNASWFVSHMRERMADDVVTDTATFLAAHPAAVVEMGYAENDSATLSRPLLAFRNRRYLLDAPAIQEHQLSGLEIPDSTVAALRSCAADYWLIPKGGDPFGTRNRYAGLRARALFPQEFRRAFFESYRHEGSTRFYDIWVCARAGQ